MKKSILCALVILAIIPTAFAGRVDLTTYYPAHYGEYKNLNSTAGSNFATTGGFVGIGTTNPTANLEVAGSIKATGSNLGLSYGRFEGSGGVLDGSRYIPLTSAPVNTGGLTLSGNGVTVTYAGYYSVGLHLSFDCSDVARTVVWLYIDVNGNQASGIGVGEVYTYYTGADSRIDTAYIDGNTIVYLNAGQRIAGWVAVNGPPQLTIYYARLTVQQLP